MQKASRGWQASMMFTPKVALHGNPQPLWLKIIAFLVQSRLNSRGDFARLKWPHYDTGECQSTESKIG